MGLKKEIPTSLIKSCTELFAVILYLSIDRDILGRKPPNKGLVCWRKRIFVLSRTSSINQFEKANGGFLAKKTPQDTQNSPIMVINCRGHLLSLERPILMGILNATPDSFYAQSRVASEKGLLAQAEQMLQEGATILDVGGMSSRPGAAEVSVEEELARVLPVVKLLRGHFPSAILSVDTYRATVAEAAFGAGAHLLNDISGGSLDPRLLQVVAQAHAPYVLMHMQGTPRRMQKNPQYGDLMTELLDFFIERIGQLQALGIQDILLDVGFGFGKTIAHNYELLANLSTYQALNCPLLVGVSRKSMIWKVLESSPAEALNGTTALHMIALQQGAKILRVHDVKAAQEVIRLWEQLPVDIAGQVSFD